MKCPNRKANLPDTAPFPHEYSQAAEYALKLLEYNMRVRIWDFIRAAQKTDPEGKISVQQVLMLAISTQCEEQGQRVKEQLLNENQVDSLLRELGI